MVLVMARIVQSVMRSSRPMIDLIGPMLISNAFVRALIKSIEE